MQRTNQKRGYTKAENQFITSENTNSGGQLISRAAVTCVNILNYLYVCLTYISCGIAIKCVNSLQLWLYLLYNGNKIGLISFKYINFLQITSVRKICYDINSSLWNTWRKNVQEYCILHTLQNSNASWKYNCLYQI